MSLGPPPILTLDGPKSLGAGFMLTVDGAVVVWVCGGATCWRKASAEVQAPPMSTRLRAVMAKRAAPRSSMEWRVRFITLLSKFLKGWASKMPIACGVGACGL